jgi:hypothetical protein
VSLAALRIYLEKVEKYFLYSSGHHPQISYCDIAAKAAECGKKELSIKLLESEIRISKQVPLLVQLGQVSTALQKVCSLNTTVVLFLTHL